MGRFLHLVDNDDGRVSLRGGEVTVFGKDGKSRVSLGVTEHGGRVQVKGKDEGAAAMGINEFGNGAVSTWDKKRLSTVIG